MPSHPDDLRHMRHAARLALRGHGGAEPNPMVGCVIVSPPPDSRVIGWGYHRRCGEGHAERIALDRAGDRAQGATAYVTLEPCSHHGRTPPCTDALIEAGIRRVVMARRDPNPTASGGADRLRAAGIAVELVDCPHAAAVSDPFVHRIQTGLPWVIAKWAQTIDGKIATRHGESKWISSARSRGMVHRERGRVDAILTGIGTVLADDPLLTARGVRRRRIARRVVIDPQLRIPPHAHLIGSIDQASLTVACSERAIAARPDHAADLQRAGVELLGLPPSRRSDADELPLGELLRELVKRHDVTNVLVEAGTGLLSRLLQENLVNEAWVFIAPLVLGDADSMSAVAGNEITSLADGSRWRLADTRLRRGDIVARYRVR
jgi:diaminohydroxyphosphoribosylaminopyrimidine deaminase/5-amino-6-(5-phosphoribosylamino)uracil reductase